MDRVMENLWAPWRMEFIKAEKREGCIFCAFPAESGEEADQRNLVLGRSAHSFAILNKYPYNNGHLMVIPRRHTAEFTALPEEELFDLHRLLQRSVRLLNHAYRPEGFNIGMNLGKVAGAGIADHLHYHVVPRWGGDTNFMPIISDTKVLIQALDESYRLLRQLYDEPAHPGI
jgi:ATP adenylyltransferase